MAKTQPFYKGDQGTYFETSHSAEKLNIWSILSMCSLLPIGDTGKSSSAFSESQDTAAEFVHLVSQGLWAWFQG